MDIRRQKQSIMDRNMFRFFLLIGLQIKALLRERNVNNENA